MSQASVHTKGIHPLKTFKIADFQGVNASCKHTVYEQGECRRESLRIDGVVVLQVFGQNKALFVSTLWPYYKTYIFVHHTRR